MDSPNLEGVDAWSFDARKVEKPWGHELIWAEAEQYVGKVLFVKAGESLSLQFHRVKDESWLVQDGRAKLELGSARGALVQEGGVAPGALFPLPPRNVHPGAPPQGTTIVRGSTPPPGGVV